MFLLLVACSPPGDAPSCTNEPMQTCSDVELLHMCHDIGVVSGLAVVFEGAAPDAYDAAVNIDGRETRFSLEGGSLDISSGSVWGVDASGFSVEDHGDEVDVAVTVDGTVFEESFDPCWDAAEVNGRCCGWSYSARVTLDLSGT